MNWHITPTINLGFEGRYSEEKIEQTVFDFDLGDMRPLPDVAEATFKKFAPRVTFDWQATPDNLFYAIYAEGQKPGGLNGPVAIAAGVPTFEEEDNQTFEVGFKNTFADGLITFNLAGFTSKIEGYQLTQLAQTATNSVSATVNAGDARINGFEVEFGARPTNNLTLTANYAFARSEFTQGFDQNEGVLLDAADDQRVNCSTGFQIPGEPCLIGNTPNSLYGSIEGRRIPRAPLHQVFADVDWRTPVGTTDWEVFAGGNVTYTSSSFAQVSNLAETGDATIVDLRAGVQSDLYKVQFYVKNLLDEDSVQQIIRYADPSFRRNFIAGLRPGRRFGVIVSAGF